MSRTVGRAPVALTRMLVGRVYGEGYKVGQGTAAFIDMWGTSGRPRLFPLYTRVLSSVGQMSDIFIFLGGNGRQWEAGTILYFYLCLLMFQEYWTN